MGIGRSRRAVGVVGGGVVLAVLAGCSGEPQPSPPLAPAVAAPASPDDAVAFARTWLSELDGALARRDGSGLRALSARSCSSCLNLAATADGLRERRVLRSGAALRVRSAEAPPVEGDRATVDLVVDLLAQRDHDERTGALVLTTRSAADVRWLAVLHRRDGAWLMAELRSAS